jgi:hypothetical protein
MRGQAGLFDVDERLKRLSDQLLAFAAAVDFETFRAALAQALAYSGGAQGERRARALGICSPVWLRLQPFFIGARSHAVQPSRDHRTGCRRQPRGWPDDPRVKPGDMARPRRVRAEGVRGFVQTPHAP